MALSPALQRNLDSLFPDWSEVTLHEVHNAITGLITDRRYIHRGTPTKEQIAVLHRSGRDIQKLLAVHAMKWAERGIEELGKKRDQIRGRLRNPNSINAYDDILLGHLDREYERLASLEP